MRGRSPLIDATTGPDTADHGLHRFVQPDRMDEGNRQTNNMLADGCRCFGHVRPSVCGAVNQVKHRVDRRVHSSGYRHLGFCDLNFAKDLKSAEGEYFNGHGRNTFGVMHLTRR